MQAGRRDQFALQVVALPLKLHVGICTGVHIADFHRRHHIRVEVDCDTGADAIATPVAVAGVFDPADPEPNEAVAVVADEVERVPGASRGTDEAGPPSRHAVVAPGGVCAGQSWPFRVAGGCHPNGLVNTVHRGVCKQLVVKELRHHSSLRRGGGAATR